MSLQKLLIYDNLFKDYSDVNPVELINNIPSIKIITILSKLNCILCVLVHRKQDFCKYFYGVI